MGLDAGAVTHFAIVVLGKSTTKSGIVLSEKNTASGLPRWLPFAVCGGLFIIGLFVNVLLVLLLLVSLGCLLYAKFSWHSISGKYAERTKFDLPRPMTQQELYEELKQHSFSAPGMTGMGLNSKDELEFVYPDGTYEITIKDTAVRVFIPLSLRDKKYFPRMATAASLAQNLHLFFDPGVVVVECTEHLRLFSIRQIGYLSLVLGLVGMVLAMVL
ncbi:hypothetical protein LJC64_03035 [Ruminococcaceae bacterium OttesenSCG-928-A11]|nr:hypothetical protein [Ruminococcaceae bacterium OttesenSCG-928-A11]